MSRRRHRERGLDSVQPTRRRRLVVRVLLRSFVSVVILVTLYYVLPFDRELDAAASLLLVLGLAVFVMIIAWHLRKILASAYPALRAIEALTTSIPVFLLIFATCYYLMNNAQPGSFSESLTRTNSLYFTITVFSTVGFGDITPTTEAARIVAMVQMLSDVVVVGVLARVVLGAVQKAQGNQETKNRAGGDQGPGQTSELNGE